MADQFDKFEIEVIAAQINSVLLTAAAQIEAVELTGEMLDKFEAALAKESHAAEMSWIFDPTFAMYHGQQRQKDIEQARKAVELIRQIGQTVEWQFSKARGE